MSTYTLSYEVSWKNPSTGAWDVIPNATVKAPLSAEVSLGGSALVPLPFGAAADPTAKIVLKGVVANLSAPWEDRPICITFGVNGVSLPAFEGIIQTCSIDVKADELTYDAIGYAELVRRTKGVSPLLYRRYGATRTTASVWGSPQKSVDDPAYSGYRGGLINYALWLAGGRPALLSHLYPNARFYYHCDQALLLTEWAWLNGEDAWAECAAVARACCGILYQSPDGIVRFVSPFSPTEGTLVGTISRATSEYQNITQRTNVSLRAARTRIPWVYRAIQAMQPLIELDAPRYIPARNTDASHTPYGTVELSFTTDHPVAQWALFDAVGDAVSLSAQVRDDYALGTLDDVPITVERNGREGKATFYQISELWAQRLGLQLKHSYDEPITWHHLRIAGAPVTPVSRGEAVRGSTAVEVREITIDDERALAYISTRDHAEQLAEVLLAYHGTARPVRTVSGARYDPALQVGDRVQLTEGVLGLSNSIHVVTRKATTNGVRMDLDLVPVGDLPQAADIYIWGAAYTTWNKQVVW